MSSNIKLLISFFIIIILLIVKEVPYVNIIVKDKLWIVGLLSLLTVFILFMSPKLIIKHKEMNIVFVFVIILLLFSTLMRITLLSEFLGTILYGLFWVLVIYKIRNLVKSSQDEDWL